MESCKKLSVIAFKPIKVELSFIDPNKLGTNIRSISSIYVTEFRKLGSQNDLPKFETKIQFLNVLNHVLCNVEIFLSK